MRLSRPGVLAFLFLLFIIHSGCTAGGSLAQAASPDTSATSTSPSTSTATATVSSGTMISAGGPCASPGCYGPAMAGDALANTTIGPWGNRVSYRFRAQRTGSLKSIRIYLLPDKVGYAAGTGGQLYVSIHADTTGNIPGTRLAKFIITNPLAATGSARYFPLITFSPMASLVAGRLYHVMFTNVDAAPTLNYLSVDALFQRTPPTPTQPGYSDLDSAVLLHNSATKGWKPRAGFTPIVQFNYSDGWTGGIGYMEAWVGAPQAIGGTKSVRQRFTVSGASRKVGTIGVRVQRNIGSSYLKVRLETSTGALIEEGTIASTAFPVGSMTWATYKLRSARTLAVGQTYHLVLTAPSGTVYQTFPIRKGMHYGFSNTTYYRDGHAQFKSGSSWVGWTQWGATNRIDGDLQFYFRLTL